MCLDVTAETDKSTEPRAQQSQKCEEICQRLEQSKYDWKWLCSLHGKAEDELISVNYFRGDAKLFARLDRNSDKNLQAIDLDRSPSNPWVRESSVLTNMFRTMDRSCDSSLTREEWVAMFGRFHDKLGSKSC